MTDSSYAFAARILKVERALADRTPQLAFQSLEAGAITGVDEEGNPQALFGQQHDGSWLAAETNGPPCLTPSGVTVMPRQNAVTVRWAGTWVESEIVPMNFTRVEVHASAMPGFSTAGASTLRATIESPRGGEVSILASPGTQLYVKLVARNLSGARGPDSVEASAVAEATPVITDGQAPARSPEPVVTGSINVIFAKWSAVANPDPVTYEAHLSTIEDFTPGPDTLISTTPATSLAIRQTATGAELSYDQIYWLRVVAKDADGPAVPSAAVPGQMRRATGEDIAADYVYAGKVYADQVEGGELRGEIGILGRLLAGAEGGQRVELDTAGLRLVGPSGAPSIDLPTDPMQESLFSGKINATGLTVNDGLELRGRSNILAPSSITKLSGSVGGSPVGPSLSIGWERFSAGLESTSDTLTGLHLEGDSVANRRACYASDTVGSLRTPTGSFLWPMIAVGNLRRSILLPRGLVRVGTSAGPRTVLLGLKTASNGAQSLVYASYDDSPILGENSSTPPIYYAERVATSTLSYVSKIGRVLAGMGTQSQFASLLHNPENGALTLRRFSVSDSGFVEVGAGLSAAIPKGIPVSGVAYGMSNLLGYPGVARGVWLVFTPARAYAFSLAGEPLPAHEFPAAPGAGVWTVAGVPWSGSYAGVRSAPTAPGTREVTRYTDVHWLTEPDRWWAGHTWVDSSDLGSGRHETDMSKLTSITMLKRAQLTVSTPRLPDPQAGVGTVRGDDDVDSVRIYMQRSATEPTRAQMFPLATQPSVGATSVAVRSTPAFAGGSNPPAETNFPGASAASLESSALSPDGRPRLRLTGDGRGLVSSLEVTSSLQGRAIDQLLYTLRAQSGGVVGGGALTATAAYDVSWSARFLTIAQGRGESSAAAGYFDIAMPPVDAKIVGHGGAADVTVTAAGIRLAAWTALYYELPFGIGPASVPGNFRVVNYTADFQVPSSWVRIVIHDANMGGHVFQWVRGDRISV